MIVGVRSSDLHARLGALSIFAMVVFAFASRNRLPLIFSTVDLAALGDDLLGFTSFALIGIFLSRVWPLWAAALQLIAVGSHFVRAVDVGLHPAAYAWMQALPTVLVYCLVIWAGVRHPAKPR